MIVSVSCSQLYQHLWAAFKPIFFHQKVVPSTLKWCNIIKFMSNLVFFKLTFFNRYWSWGFVSNDHFCIGFHYISIPGWYTLSQMVSWKNVWNPDEEMVKQWIAEVGPITTSVYVSNEFAAYSGGVLNARDCCNQKQNPRCRYVFMRKRLTNDR